MAVSSAPTRICLPAAAARRSPSRNPSFTASTTCGQREVTGDVQLRRVADLGVDDTVQREVLGALGSHSGQRIDGLHDPDRVGEGLEVALQGAGVGRRDEPRRELRGVGARQALVPRLRRELDDRSWA